MIGLQMTMPELTAHMAQGRVAIGATGENVIARAFEARGYSVRTAYENGDLHVITPAGELNYVEVKTARRGKDGKWRFTLYKKNSQDHRYSDYVVLLCVMKSGFSVPFVIPTRFILDRHAIAITSYPQTYSGRFAQFRQSLKTLRLPQ